MKFFKKSIGFITLFFLSIITSIICTAIIVMLSFIIKEIGFVENINSTSFDSIFILFILPTAFLLSCFLFNYWREGWKKTTQIDDTDLNTYNEENTRENMNSIKNKEVQQFCYDFSNPCPYCDTKFEHTALHCAVYFSDIERIEEVIELIKKADEVDGYNFGVSDFYDTIFGKIFDTKDFLSQTSLTIAVRMGSIETIKLLLQILQRIKGYVGLEMYIGNDQWLSLDLENEDSIKKVIDYFKYKKKTKTGKDTLDEDDKNSFSKGYIRTLI